MTASVNEAASDLKSSSPITQSLAATGQSRSTENSFPPNSAIRPNVRAEIAIPPQPIKLQVDTSTDWFAAVVTPIMVGLSAALIAWVNQRNSIRSTEASQKNQLRSTTATFRQTWSNDFRTFGAEYIAQGTRLMYKSFEKPGFVQTPEADDFLSRMAVARASIRMMLDPGKTYTSDITKIMDATTDAIFAEQHDEVEKQLGLFVDKVQEIREVAWKDMRRDLSLL
jgi:hypothetical protein